MLVVCWTLCVPFVFVVLFCYIFVVLFMLFCFVSLVVVVFCTLEKVEVSLIMSFWKFRFTDVGF